MTLDDELALDEVEGEDEILEDVLLSAAVYLAGVGIACSAYKIPITLHLAVAEDRVFGQMDMAEPYHGRRFVKAKAYHLRLTKYAVATLCGRAAMVQTLGHIAGSERDADDAGAYLDARARRHISKAERDQSIEQELRPKAAALLKHRREAIIRVASALIRAGTLSTPDIAAIVYPRRVKPH